MSSHCFQPQFQSQSVTPGELAGECYLLNIWPPGIAYHCAPVRIKEVEIKQYSSKPRVQLAFNIPSQVSPSKFSAQLHKNESPSLSQVPPFLQGVESQGLCLGSKKSTIHRKQCDFNYQHSS